MFSVSELKPLLVRLEKCVFVTLFCWMLLEKKTQNATHGPCDENKYLLKNHFNELVVESNSFDRLLVFVHQL